MKKVYLFLLTILMSLQIFAQVSVGTGTFADYKVGPIGCYWGYSYYQIIYRAADINASGSITGLQFEMDNTNSIPNSDNNVDVWIGHTTKSNFETAGTDWFDVSTLTQVLTNGTITKEGKFLTITFETPFEYDGVQNIVIAVDANEAGFDSINDKFLHSESSDQELVATYKNHDDQNPDPNSPTQGISTRYYPNVTFLGITQTCPLPTDITVSNITDMTANIAWTEVGTSTNWVLEYGVEGFQQGTGTTINISTTPSVALSNLISSTKYDVYIKSVCSQSEESTFVSYSFETVCASIFPASYNVSFEQIPDCWVEAQGEITDTPTEMESMWKKNRAFTDAMGNVINSNTINLYSDEHREWLITPNFDLSSGNYELKIITAVTDYTYSGTSTADETDEMGSDDQVHLMVSTDNGATWASLYYWGAYNQPLSTGTTYIQNLSAYTGNTKFAILASDGTVDNMEDYDFHIGHFEIRTAASCPGPNNLSANVIDAHQATLSFAEQGSATNWQIEFGENGFEQGNGTLITSTDTFYLAENLNSETDYQFYVRAICGAGDSSYWSGPYNFATPVSCPIPSALSAEVSSFSATLNWAEQGSATNWQIEFGENGFGQGNGTFITSTDTFYLAENLNSETDYQFYVRAICGAGDSSAWVGPYSFSTLVSCPTPNHLSTVNLLTDGATLVWKELASATNFMVEFGETGFTQGTGLIINVTDTFYTMTPLVSATKYDFYVRSICGVGDSSAWSGVYSFTTPCVSFNVPYQANFESNPPSCWDMAHGELEEGPIEAASSYSWRGNRGFSDEFGNPVNSNVINLYDNTNREWLISPDFNLEPNNNMQLRLITAITGWSNSGISAIDANDEMGADDSVNLLISEDGGVTWTVLTTWNAQNEPSVNGTEYIHSLSSYSSTVKFAIFASDGTVDEDQDYDFHIGLFEIETEPTCPKPSNLMAENATGSSVDLSWTENGSATNWNLEFGLEGFTQGNGTTIAVTENLYNLTGLTAGSNYEYYVQAYCGEEDTSQWVGPFTFQTFCTDAIMPNYSASFNNNPPLCWSEGSGFLADGPSGATSEWKANRAYTHEDGTVINSNKINLYDTSHKEWLITPNFDLSNHSYSLNIEVALTNYKNQGISDVNHTDNMGSDDVVALLISEDNGASWTNLMTWNAQNQPAVTGSAYTIDLSAYTSNVKFALFATDGTVNDSEDFDFHIGHFEIKAVENATCTTPSALSVSEIAESSAIISWIENGTATNWNIEYGETGFVQGNGTTVSVTENPYTMANLNADVTYDIYVQAVCSETDSSAWSEVISFTTIATECMVPSALNVTNTTGNSATLGWTENGTATSWKVEYGMSGFTQGNGTMITVTENPFIVSGLTANTEYEFWVRANCSETNQSEWAGSFVFTTNCSEAYTAPYSAEFGINTPVCWNDYEGGELTEGPTLSTISTWRGDRSFTNAEGLSISSTTVNLYNNSHREWLVSPVIDLGTDGFELVTKVAVTTYQQSGNSAANDNANMGSDDAVYLLISNDNGINWTELGVWNAQNQPTVNGTEQSFNLSGYQGEVKFALFATDGTIDDTNDYDFHLGLFEITNSTTVDVINSSQKISYYPNPLKNVLTIKANSIIDIVEIYSLNHTLLYQNNFYSKEVKIDFKSWNSGTYIVRAIMDKKVKNFKIIKE